MSVRDPDDAAGRTWPGGWKPVRYAERCRRKKAELTERLERFVAYCRTKPDVAVVAVFGSYARDAVTPWSDIDVLVVRDAARDARSIDLADDLYREGGLGGDIVAVPASRYPHDLEATPFGRTILAEHTVVYERSA